MPDDRAATLLSAVQDFSVNQHGNAWVGHSLMHAGERALGSVLHHERFLVPAGLLHDRVNA